MTHQEFNYFYVKFTKLNKGIKLHERIHTTGYELKEFVEFIIEDRSKIDDSRNH